jgi:NAD(P)-dependent dehydrogenase (short-subunit alcohol dehydrogenase family)
VGYQSIFKDGLFAGQTVVITGGGSGIGRCTAHELAALGAEVAIIGRSADKLNAVQAEIRDDGGRVSIHSADIRDEAGSAASSTRSCTNTAASTGCSTTPAANTAHPWKPSPPRVLRQWYVTT